MIFIAIYPLQSIKENFIHKDNGMAQKSFLHSNALLIKIGV